MLRQDFEHRHDLAIYFDMIASESIVFGPFFRGCNISNPVNQLELRLLIRYVGEKGRTLTRHSNGDNYKVSGPYLARKALLIRHFESRNGKNAENFTYKFGLVNVD